MQIFCNQVENTFKPTVTSRSEFEMDKNTLCYKLFKAEPAQKNLTVHNHVSGKITGQTLPNPANLNDSLYN